jgi:hypothetical protein
VREVDLERVVRGDDEARRRSIIDETIAALRGEQETIRQRMENAYDLLDLAGSATSFVAQKLQQLEDRRSVVEAELRESEQERARLGLIVSDGKQVKALIKRLQDRNQSDAVYKLRSTIAARLKSLVRVIYLAPVGRGLLTQLNIESDEPGAGPVVDEIRSAMVTQRYFAVGLHDGSVRVIFPDRDAALRFTHADPLPRSDDSKGESKEGESAPRDQRSTS